MLAELGEGYGVRLLETNGHVHRPAVVVVEVGEGRTRRVLVALLEAVRASGHARGALSADRVKPIRLSEEAGVRLALALLASAPVAKPMRVDAMLRAVQALTVEETYYWYAKCMGDDAGRLRRALRLFLAEE